MLSESDFSQLLSEKIATYTPSLIRLRRDFHRFPEPGWCEIRTSSIIADQLTCLGYEILTDLTYAIQIPVWDFRPKILWKSTIKGH